MNVDWKLNVLQMDVSWFYLIMLAKVLSLTWEKRSQPVASLLALLCW